LILFNLIRKLFDVCGGEQTQEIKHCLVFLSSLLD
jgi:hypothetical protein